jgi:hypothetical protein
MGMGDTSGGVSTYPFWADERVVESKAIAMMQKQISFDFIVGKQFDECSNIGLKR